MAGGAAWEVVVVRRKSESYKRGVAALCALALLAVVTLVALRHQNGQQAGLAQAFFNGKRYRVQGLLSVSSPIQSVSPYNDNFFEPEPIDDYGIYPAMKFSDYTKVRRRERAMTQDKGEPDSGNEYQQKASQSGFLEPILNADVSGEIQNPPK
ncbi:hypothetical protein GUITHDRAFT_164801 [Guillardia theta CCMP2712]|uniref:Uncharacterized protein n=1 Tax=Guillardia theta (strain CCMP2712) TaxID=905079 RepID=L1IUL8_GUITC|nr:hypothetical protein GUITHDRAFT_164801 [Guillardia theta CCMP2712]EKX39956.1 hypothetical protein GUITHDRAFT_164801 [Guillardia theta CCMP2712]|eukprot:XP_005826936.1 hypothetical protein GUITHDRAFT_164801 [Guillardia theta CCMP2712]